MNRTLKTLLTCILCLSLAVATAINASAAGLVTYDGNAKEFIFEPGSKYSPTDLFTDFKGVMPGDSITQQVYIVNDPEHGVKVDIYMRALGPTPENELTESYVTPEANDAFLSQLDLTVTVRDGEELFKAPANETDGLTEWVLLGTFYSGAEVTLDVTLDVPLTLGNEYQNAIGFLDWQFRVEEFPIGPDDPKPPETGDDNIIVYCGIAACVCVGCVFFLLLGKRRRNDEEEQVIS